MRTKLRQSFPWNRRSVAVLVLAAAVTATACSSVDDGSPQAAGSSAASAIVEAIPPTALIIDASDSMLADDAPGLRIDAAKLAATTLVDAIPAGSELAVLTYGTGTGNSPQEYEAGCRDVTEIVPLGEIDRVVATEAINALEPRGFTPIAESLRRAATVLPGDGPASIVLISDGEDICGQPPCDVARQLKQEHPNLQISTVGFKTEGQASADLQCVADATGGIFVTAANPAQLTARLLATQNADSAATALNGGALRGIGLGTELDDIRNEHNDFPADGTRSGDQTVIIWMDCEWVFNTDGTLEEIRPQTGARTIDGLTVGDPLARAVELYGEPAADTADGRGARQLIFIAEPDTDIGYRIGVDGPGDDARITSIVVCRCLPSSASAKEPTQTVLRPFKTDGSVASGWSVDSSKSSSSVDCDSTTPSPSAVSDGILYCSPSASSADTCYGTATSNYVHCVVDPFSNQVVRYSLMAGFTTGVKASSEPVALGLLLDDGTQCRRRDGGSWSAQVTNPDLLGWYTCKNDRMKYPAIWAESGGDGITRGPDGWTVLLGEYDKPLETRAVTEMFYVGIAS